MISAAIRDGQKETDHNFWLINTRGEDDGVGWLATPVNLKYSGFHTAIENFALHPKEFDRTAATITRRSLNRSYKKDGTLTIHKCDLQKLMVYNYFSQKSDGI